MKKLKVINLDIPLEEDDIVIIPESFFRKIKKQQERVNRKLKKRIQETYEN